MSSENKVTKENEEYLTTENPNRFVIFPIKHKDMWEMYNKHRNVTWSEHDLDLGPDKKDWSSLNNDERHFIKNVLAFFAASDGIVMENLGSRFINDLQVPEARAFYSMQLFIEQIHSNTYSMLIETLIDDDNEKNTLFTSPVSILLYF